jgi:hypothetical protein
MKGLLGTNEGEDDPALRQMWNDGLKECVCPLGRITYDDFRVFIKGQKREKETIRPGLRRTSVNLTNDAIPLQPVPEGSLSPQPVAQAFPRFFEATALSSLSLPPLGGGIPNVQSGLRGMESAADTQLPGDRRFVPEVLPRRLQGRGRRSRSEGNAFDEGDGVTYHPIRGFGEAQRATNDESTSIVDFHKTQRYQKHREFRNSVIVASKLFDQKHKARKFARAQDSAVKEGFASRLQTSANLVLKHGVNPGVSSGSCTFEAEGNKSDPHLKSLRAETEAQRSTHDIEDGSFVGSTKSQVDDASRRSGRPRRQRTTSDISGMLR